MNNFRPLSRQANQSSQQPRPRPAPRANNSIQARVEEFAGTESDSDITSVSRMIPNNVDQQNTYEGLELTYTIDGKSFFHGRIDRRLAESKLYNATYFKNKSV